MIKRFMQYFFPDVDVLGIPDQPRKRAKQLPTETTSTPNNVEHGKEWIYTRDGEKNQNVVHTWDAVDSDKQKTVINRVKTLTGWDHVFLDENFADTTKGWDATIARVCKEYWANGMSSNAISREKTVNGLTQDGFSVRNVKKYTSAYNRSFEREQAEKDSKG